ncbi:hypothetical protein [Bradyrhizobium sp. DASA03120]
MMISTARSDDGCWITRRFLTRLRGDVEARMLAVEVEQLIPVRPEQFT